jgi:hypothetical protein
MERHVIALERHNLHELEAVEQLATELGAEAFEAVAMELASAYTIDPDECQQSIRRFYHPSLIGMTDVPFDALQKVCKRLIEREPHMLEKLTYRCRDNQRTALPHGLWLQLVEHAQQGI